MLLRKDSSHSILGTSLLLSLWLLFPANLAFWQHLWQSPFLSFLTFIQLGSILMVSLGALFFFLSSLFAWSWVYKLVWSVLLLVSAVTQYFMLQYGAVIDTTMLGNALHTNAAEVRDLLSWQMAGMVLLVGGLPCVWLWRRRLHWAGWPFQLLSNILAASVALAVLLLALWLGFQGAASLMRNDKALRYTVNPLNSILGLGHLAVRSIQPKQNGPLQTIASDARLGPSYDTATAPPLFVLVVGETARAASFSIGGYGKAQGRDTTPYLQKLQAEQGLVYFDQVASCSTNTEVSLPCMLSKLSRDQGGNEKRNNENLLDVLQRAGLAVLWIDNQSGCKGLCDRVAYYSMRSNPPAECANGECLDEHMLDVLATQWQALPAKRRAKGTVIVLHQMGSRGPNYFKRAAPERKAFQPECTSAVLSDCSREQITNAYDNSILETDHFLHSVWQWLQTQDVPSALLYASDHGESLGENSVYLHGMPYAFAPQEQTHVPMAIWLSSAMQKRLGLGPDCLRAQAQKSLSHDNLFHSVLGLMDVLTQTRQPQLDIFASCRKP